MTQAPHVNSEFHQPRLDIDHLILGVQKDVLRSLTRQRRIGNSDPAVRPRSDSQKDARHTYASSNHIVFESYQLSARQVSKQRKDHPDTRRDKEFSATTQPARIRFHRLQ